MIFHVCVGSPPLRTARPDFAPETHRKQLPIVVPVAAHLGMSCGITLVKDLHTTKVTGVGDVTLSSR